MASSQHSPVPARSAFPSSIPSARRTSTSAIPITSSSPNTSTAASSPHAPTSIPSFRALRSLLPFRPHKPTTPISSTVAPTPHVASRSPFAHFGTVRRSMQRERMASLSLHISPVISIDRSTERLQSEEEPPLIRRSVSCSKLDKPLPGKPGERVGEGDSNEFHDGDDTVVFTGQRAPMLRMPSPGPPISADLSTILEADTSGISKHIPSASESSRAPSPSPSPFAPGTPADACTPPDTDTSALDLSTTHLTMQVLDAIMAEDSHTARQWLNADKAVIVDEADEVKDSRDAGPNGTFNLSSLEPDLAALLSPIRLSSSSHTSKSSNPHLNSKSSANGLLNTKNLTITPYPPPSTLPPSQTKLKQPIDFTKLSPASPHFPPSPSSPSHEFTPGGSVSSGSMKALSRSRLPRQSTSSLPRLKSQHQPSASLSISGSGTQASGMDEFGKTQHGPLPSPLASSTSASHLKANPSPTSSTSRRLVSQPLLSSSTGSGSNAKALFGNGTSSPKFATPFTRSTSTSGTTTLTTPTTSTNASTSALLPSPSLTPPSTSATASVSEWGETIKLNVESASPSRHGTPPIPPRASFDTLPLALSRGGSARGSTREGGSLDYQRPLMMDDLTVSPSRHGSDYTYGSPSVSASPSAYETPARPSLDTALAGGRPPLHPDPQVQAHLHTSSTRTRKRSMSVQERFARVLGGSAREREHRGDEFVAGTTSEFGEADRRPSSSLSGRGGAYARSTSGIGAGPPMTEWLGPRTVKAFRAAGLLDGERDMHSSSGSGNGSVLGRFASLRNTPPSGGGTASEYGYGGYGGGGSGRAPSRMAFSEAGSGSTFAGGSVSRRGSGSGSALYSYGLMESPTFTVSSGSRDRGERERDTPRSASTAPTSVSGSSFAFMGRERERSDQELAELKAKHTLETGALLSALSDSQRTVRVLREEVGELRERLERLGRVEMENETLREVVGGLKGEVRELRGSFVGSAGVGAGVSGKGNGRFGTWNHMHLPGRRSGLSMPLYVDEDEERDRNDGVGWGTRERQDGPAPELHKSRTSNYVFNSGIAGKRGVQHEERRHLVPQHHDDLDLDDPLSGPLSSSTPAAVSKIAHARRRRPSTTSSIFPVPPPNMTMLLHDHEHEDDDDDDDTDGSFTMNMNSKRFTGTKSASGAHSNGAASTGGRGTSASGHAHTSSVKSISPTTASFSMSMATGSPSSLFLKPEHEVHLGDMESLDLGRRRSEDEDDEWGE
ncbi:hypothetical protein Hypma_000455 [Hypsizygus marmoreus]|uniref:Uncharacterized protein n=1 Tax=Hypsizygus marmoreus TaxID=39966 RepID=A0A369JFL6_HYPMA|nr:hypothetical protein Hypma_000455 [Hypsizygus marmoreus]